MIGHASEKVLKQWQKAPVALRLVVEYLDEKFGGGLLVFRIDAPTKFEKGVHAAGLAMDLELRGDAQAIERACLEVNKRFFPRGPGVQVCTIKENLANFPSGRRADRPVRPPCAARPRPHAPADASSCAARSPPA